MKLVNNIAANVDYIIAMYEKFGANDYIGEPISQIEHMCQCAQLAEENGADEETVLAAFLHDIGHLCAFQFPEVQTNYMDELGVVNHEQLGAAFLRSNGFSENVAKMVEHHVLAKRYLTFKFPEYFNLLSEASKQTLQRQGGIMQEHEALHFELDPLADRYVALRRWDEQAKEIHKPLPDLNKYKEMMLQHLLAQ